MSPPETIAPVQGLNLLLSQTLGDELEIKRLDWKPLTNPGENFGSVILAINVTIARQNGTETLNLVAKLPPKSAYLLDLFDSPLTFKKELHFYSEITKEFKAVQVECGIDERNVRVFAPNFLGGRLGSVDGKFDDRAVILLENLAPNGYATVDRIAGLDEAHTRFAVEELAKMHAVTVALKLRKPKLFEERILRVIAEPVNKTAEECVVGMVRKAQQDLMALPETAAYQTRIDRTIKYGSQNLQSRIPEEPWGTLIHNDFWVNNMMFKHGADGTVVDMKIVDFQLCSYDYGICDLIFFLISSASYDILDRKLQQMLDHYYDTFVGYLKRLDIGTEKFAKTKFDELVKLCAPFKFNQCIMMIQVIKATQRPSEKSLEDDQIFLKNGGDEVYNEKLAHTVKLFVEREWLLK